MPFHFARKLHLFAAWPAPGTKDAEKHRLLAQAAAINDAYSIEEYVRNAKSLLRSSKEGANPYDGFSVSEPKDSVRIETSSPQSLQVCVRVCVPLCLTFPMLPRASNNAAAAPRRPFMTWSRSA